jgi:hypothetical protein
MGKKRPRASYVSPSPWVEGEQDPKVIVLHTTESDGEGDKFLVSLKRYMDRNMVSVHSAVAADGAIGYFAYADDKCRHAPPNAGKIGIEQAGFASFTRKQWIARRKQRQAVAKLIAWYSYRWGIPIRKDVKHGVAEHKDFPLGGHHDCGDGYPLAKVLRLARRYKLIYYRGQYK